MNQPPFTPWKIAAGLVCAALLTSAGSASAELAITTDNQLGTANVWPFTPAFVVDTNASLIAGQSPATALGNFDQENQAGDRNANSVTANTDLTLNKSGGTTSTNYVTVGYNGGTSLIYTLPTTANGYNLTNITAYGGWADNGRDALGFTVLYSTVADPDNFVYLTTVNYNPTVPGNTPSANRAIINDSLGGTIAANVAAIEFDFTTPHVENGYTGLGTITVGGTPATSTVPPVISITVSNQNDPGLFVPTWPVETPSLIAGLDPTTADGNFTQESSAGTNILTDGILGTSGDLSGFATCGSSGGTTLIYKLPNVVNGDDVTNVVVYSGWGNANRDGQYYILSYSTIAAPTTYIPITTVYYNPQGISGASANRVAVAKTDGTPLAVGAANLKFDFASPAGASGFDNGYCGISEIIVQGNDSTAPTPPPSPYLTQDTMPVTATDIEGDQVVFTAGYSNFPPASLQWQKVVGGVTNDVPGATSATLTLTNVQIADSGSYLLKAVNATNSSAAPSYSTARTLTVSAVPAPVNGVINKFAAQTGLNSGEFIPTWTMDTNSSLIAGQLPTAVGQGNFSLEADGRVVDSLTAGGDGAIYLIPNEGLNGTTTSTNYVSCGTSPAGMSLTYTLPTSANGYDLTNIVVYGGWADGGRDEQKYNVYYSTVSAPTTFNALETVDFNPPNPTGARSATRVTLSPSGAALAQNVYAIQFDFNLVGSPAKNGWEGYSQIIVAGTPSAPKPILVQDITPLNASDVEGGQVTLTAGFTGATSYQWQKDGTNISGATDSTLTLSNLQLSDTATNGGYRLIASNVSGSASSRGCSLVVVPAPAATNNVVVSLAAQTSDAQTFGPTWTVAPDSLIAYAYPSDMGTGNFNDPDNNPVSSNQAGGVPVLTDGLFGSVDGTGPHYSFATCGTSAGQFVTYTLDTSVFTNGYTLTNIVVGSGWNDAGRDQQAYTVYYATTANPLFQPLASVNYNPADPGGIRSFARATLTSPTGTLVSNVTAVMFDFTSPAGENGYSGYDEIAVYGTPSSGAVPDNTIVTTTENQNTDAPTWTIETDSLIAGQLPGSVGTGSFAGGFNGEQVTEGLPALTDVTFGPFNSISGLGTTNFATCGGAFGAGSSVTYTASSGWDLTNIIVYSGWGDFGRDGQFYDVSYSTLSAPTTFLPLTTIEFNPPNLGGPSANRVAIARLDGTPLASSVAAVKFDFTRQNSSLDNGYSGYAEIVLQGKVLASSTPPTIHSPYVSGGNLILTGGGGAPNSGYTLLTTTNLALPLSAWTVSATGALDGSGSFSNSIPVNAQEPGRFYQIRIP
jgi:hypothetical protein